jgi:hypothetical protein
VLFFFFSIAENPDGRDPLTQTLRERRVSRR